ncbi:MAG TPA: caspase family protein [Gammaproteobacteria bacterium]
MRKALLVGIDKYQPNADDLAGCVNDANRMRDILIENEDGSPNFDCRTLTAGDDTIEGADLLGEIDALFKDKADFALFHYSGHGTINNLGGYLMTQDSRAYREGVRMDDIITIANNSPVDEILIILDCCHSGAFGNQPDKDNKAELREGISILTASRDSQLSEEEDGFGIFASLIGDALEGGAADILGRVTVGSLYAYVDQSLGPWAQRPLFKSHVERFTSIRNCHPALDPQILRRLTEYFDAPDAIHELDPSYEPEKKPKDPDNEAIFADLQKMRATRLVEPLTEDHLYWEAVNKGGCQLTTLGRYYWHLVNAKRI